MLKAVVDSGREDVVDATELLQVAESLELLGVDDVPTKRVKEFSYYNWSSPM